MPGGTAIEDMAWHVERERLAVSTRGGRVQIYLMRNENSEFFLQRMLDNTSCLIVIDIFQPLWDVNVGKSIPKAVEWINDEVWIWCLMDGHM